MAHHAMHIPQDYDIANIPDFGHDQFLHEGTSTASSPSPIMWQLSDPYINRAGDVQFEHYQDSLGYAFYDPIQPAPVVEFTDLTAPYSEDRRRRRAQTKDKQAISSMHMRRRAQNRASQRAFRERKEKHAQDLQRQLDELSAKHEALKESYDKLGSANEQLLNELDGLRSKILAVQASHRSVDAPLEAGTPESLAEDPQEEHDHEALS